MKAIVRWCLVVWLPPVALFAVLLALWQVVVVQTGVQPFLVPAPGAVLQAAQEHQAELLGATGRTAAAALCGLALSLVVGTLVGIAFSQSAIVRRSCYPYAILLQTVPSVALAPLVILWFGHGFASVVVVAFIISMFPIITNSTAGMLAVDRQLLELFEMSNASRWQVLWKLRLPNSMPHIVTGAKIACGLSVIGAIVGEIFAGYGTESFGLGYLITVNSTKLATDYLFAAVLAAMLLGVAIFAAVSLAGEVFLRLWYAPGEATERSLLDSFAPPRGST
jgi:NitT/TauT family transport system permease protein